jgi:hypothetical protein
MTARRPPAVATVALVALLALGCTAASPLPRSAGPTGPSSVPAPASSVASSSVVPSASTDAEAQVLRAEAGGLVLTASLDRTLVAAGGAVVITATLRNPTSQPISVAGCGKPSGTAFVPMPEGRVGKAWTGMARRFKAYVLEHGNGPGIVPSLEPLAVALRGDACASLDLEMELAPGDAVSSSLTWTAALVDGVDALPGPVPFQVTAGYDLLNAPPSRDPDATGPGVSWSPMYRQIAVEGTIEVLGRQQALVGPGEAVDALLGDPTFARWLADRPATTWSNANLFLTSQPEAVGILPAGPSWDIELFREIGVPRNWAIAFVDPFDAAVRSVTYCDVPCDR